MMAVIRCCSMSGWSDRQNPGFLLIRMDLWRTSQRTYALSSAWGAGGTPMWASGRPEAGARGCQPKRARGGGATQRGGVESSSGFDDTQRPPRGGQSLASQDVVTVTYADAAVTGYGVVQWTGRPSATSTLSIKPLS